MLPDGDTRFPKPPRIGQRLVAQQVVFGCDQQGRCDPGKTRRADRGGIRMSGSGRQNRDIDASHPPIGIRPDRLWLRAPNRWQGTDRPSATAVSGRQEPASADRAPSMPERPRDCRRLPRRQHKRWLSCPARSLQRRPDRVKHIERSIERLRKGMLRREWIIDRDDRRAGFASSVEIVRSAIERTSDKGPAMQMKHDRLRASGAAAIDAGTYIHRRVPGTISIGPGHSIVGPIVRTFRLHGGFAGPRP